MNNTHSSSSDNAVCSARGALVEVLLQVRGLLMLLNQDQYVLAPVGDVRSSIASHVRHALEHVKSLLRATGTGRLDYDLRDRDTPVERELPAATAEIDSLIDALRRIDPIDANADWTLGARVTESGATLGMRTTPLRELVFVLSHTIHHNALIGVLARRQGISLPARFGYAPSTPVSETECQPCAR
ncbi:MAG: hypothetical protein U0570_08510 [Phycisphaerales bacterium]